MVTPHETLANLPAQLYKYSSLQEKRADWIEQLLVDGRLYFPRPAQFNDPLDCRIPPTFEASELKMLTPTQPSHTNSRNHPYHANIPKAVDRGNCQILDRGIPLSVTSMRA